MTRIVTERGQSFADFKTGSRNELRPGEVLYLAPIDDFDRQSVVSLDELKQYAAAYFAMPVDRLKLRKPKRPYTEREHGFSGRQYLTSDILSHLRTELPANAYGALAVTMVDLYRGPHGTSSSAKPP